MRGTGLTAGLNMDVTINTDFAQVEVDEQQVNLTRFGLFYPEKRDFSSRTRTSSPWAPAAPSRRRRCRRTCFSAGRIGLSDSGTPIPIEGGVRVAGKSGAQQHRRARYPDRRFLHQAR
jgi:hypothetical protein